MQRTLRDDFLGALTELENTFVEADGSAPAFTWHNKNVPCVPSEEGRGTVLEIGGIEFVVEFTLIVRMDNFLTADSTLITGDSELFTGDNDTPTPVAGKTLRFRGRNYRILETFVGPTQAYCRMTLGDPNKTR